MHRDELLLGLPPDKDESVWRGTAEALCARELGGRLSPDMPMDLYRTTENFVACIDLPGVAPETLDIDVEERTLTIRAERKAPSTR